MLFGGGLGITDFTTKLFLIEGSLLLNIAETTTARLEGSITVPNSPSDYYIKSTLEKLDYSFVTGSWEGTANTDIQIPAGSGAMFKTDSCHIYFFGNKNNLDWTVWSDAKVEKGIKGAIFSDIRYKAHFMLDKPKEGAVKGHVIGQLDWKKTLNYCFPEGWITDEGLEKAKETCYDAFWGGHYGAKGAFDINLQGALNAILDEHGLAGSVGASLDASAEVTMMWPKYVIWGDDNIVKANAQISGSMEINRSDDVTSLTVKDMKLTYKGEDMETGEKVEDTKTIDEYIFTL